MKRHTIVALLTGALLSTAVFAEEERLPTWSGGIGTAERELIEQKQNDYTLKIIFTGEGGMYVSGVTVVITDKEGSEVVNLVTRGPVLLADLPPGRYAVSTEAEGNKKDFKISLHSKLTTQHVRYPIKDDSGV